MSGSREQLVALATLPADKQTSGVQTQAALFVGARLYK
jgi:hypothetical protein